MATAKKTTTAKITTVTSKAATQKVAAQKTAAPKAPAAKAPAAPAPGLAVTQPIAPVAAKPATVKTISKSEWKAMVEQAAYYIAEKNGFSGDPQAHWSAAEADIAKSLKARGISVA